MCGSMAALVLDEEKSNAELLELAADPGLEPEGGYFHRGSTSMQDDSNPSNSACPSLLGHKPSRDPTEEYVILNFLEQARKSSIII